MMSLNIILRIIKEIFNQSKQEYNANGFHYANDVNRKKY